MVVHIEDMTPASGARTEAMSSTPPQINEQTCSDTVCALEDAKVNLDKSSKCLMNCFSGELQSSNGRFILVRSKLTRLAIVFMDLHLPLATKVVADLREAVMLYADCDIKEFKKNIRDIKESMSEQALSAALLTRTYELLLTDLYGLKTEMRRAIVSIGVDEAKKKEDASNARENGDKEKKMYDDEANKMKICKAAADLLGVLGVGAAFAVGPATVATGAVAAVGGAAGLYYRTVANDKEKKATAAGDGAKMKAERAAKAATEEALECSKAVTLIKEEMIDSLTQFTKAIGQVSKFLNLLSSETTRYADNCKKVEQKKQTAYRMAQYLKAIKFYEKRIISACDLFVGFQVIVQARCNSLSFLDAADAPMLVARKWCVGHEASGKLQPAEHSRLQGLILSPRDSTLTNRQGRANIIAAWLGLGQILKKLLRLRKKRRA